MPKHVNFKLHDTIAVMLDSWMAKHPDIDRTTVCNMALREFLAKAHTLEPVVMQAPLEEVNHAVDMMIHCHADTLEILK